MAAMSNKEFLRYLRTWDAILATKEDLSELDLTLHTVPAPFSKWFAHAPTGGPTGILYVLTHGEDHWDLTYKQALAWTVWSDQKREEQSHRWWIRYLLDSGEEGEEEEEKKEEEASHAGDR